MAGSGVGVDYKNSKGPFRRRNPSEAQPRSYSHSDNNGHFQNSGFERNYFNRSSSSSHQNRGGASHKPTEGVHEKWDPVAPATARRSYPKTVSSTDADVADPQLASLSGNCPDMCPAKERIQRERLRDLAVFERLNGNPLKTSPSLAVKKFCRTISISDIQISDIRPLSVLWSAMRYLWELVDTSGYAFEIVHDFVFDRTRAIRQELSMQNITGDQTIIMHEQMARFHILSQHKLYQLNNKKDTSMLHLNYEQLSKCLKSLFDLYNANANNTSETWCQGEFFSYYVLMNMGSQSLAQGESLAQWFRTVRPIILKSKEMKFARNVLRCYRMGNFKGFFDLVRKSTYLEACLMEQFFNEVRTKAVECINRSCYKLNPFSLADLAELLMMTEYDIEDFCSLCGLPISTDEKGHTYLIVKQLNFSSPQNRFPCYSCPFIEGKLDSSYSLEITKNLSVIRSDQ